MRNLSLLRIKDGTFQMGFRHIQKLVKLYTDVWVKDGKWTNPNLSDCLDFMATEVAEAIDKRLRMSEYYRNNPGPVVTEDDIAEEIWDAIMMGCIALTIMGKDLYTVMEDKLCEMHDKRIPT